MTGKFPEKVEKDSKSNPFDSESNRSEKRKNPFSSCSDSGNMNQSSVSNPFETSSLKGGQINPFQKKATNPFE